MLTVVGYPRSGTNFLHRMLAHYLDGPDVAVWPGTPVHPQINKIHWVYQDTGERTRIYIYRDPRDCALSGWEYIKHHYIPGLSLSEFLEGAFSGHWDLWPAGWRDHTLRWLERGVPTVCYETLCADRENVLRGLIAKLGMVVDERRIAHAIAHSYLVGDKRSGSVGRWKYEMPLWAVGLIGDRCGDVMGELGY